MPVYFSPSASAFFDEAIHTSMPADACPISDADHAALMQQQAEGCRITSDVNGLPVALPPPAASTEQLFAAMRRRRGMLLSACDHTQLPDIPVAQTVRDAWATYRQALRDLPEIVTDPRSITWPIPPT